MVRTFAVSAVLLMAPLLTPPATAQEPEALQAFVTSFAAPVRTTGKIARWEDGICPLTVGQQPALTKYVSQRVKQVAATVGAPVNDAPSCTPNIEIVFTKVPQDLLNNIRTREPEYLGNADNNAERERLATVTRPLQAWYSTKTMDLRGVNRNDSYQRPGYLPDANIARATGNRLSDGVRSAFNHIVIVADVTRLTGYEAGPLADYIALLALAQLNSLDTCQQLASVETMLAKGCEAKTGALTPYDTAYLRGLYKMNPDTRLLSSQKNDIAESMKATLAGR